MVIEGKVGGVGYRYPDVVNSPVCGGKVGDCLVVLQC